MVATALRFRIVVGAGIALAVLSFLPLPTPHPEARLFSNGWGTAGATDPNFCLAPVGGVPRLALFDKAPCSAQWSDRLSLATHYLVWGLLPPAAALRIAFHPQGGARHPALLVFDLLGMDPAYFHWTVNPAFVGLYQWLEEAWFVRWPPGESQFIRLDALALSVWLVGWTAFLGGSIGLALSAPLRATPCWAPTARKGSTDYRLIQFAQLDDEHSRSASQLPARAIFRRIRLMASGHMHPLALALACVFPLAHAEETSTLPTVTVTAKGYASENMETPAAVTVLDRQSWLDAGAQNVGGALRGRPGLAVASDGAQGQNPVIRGLKKESVVLLVDGMRLNSAQPAGAIASFMSLGLAERVEVVKGPASVLYGTGALGGAINVLLPQAQFAPGVRLNANAGFASASRGTDGSGVINASAGDHALMLGAAASRIGDYRSPEGKVARTDYDSDSFIGQYRFRLDGAQQLRLSLQQHTDRDVWYPGSAKPGTPALLGIVTVRSPHQARRLAELGYSRKGGGDRPVNVDVRAYRQELQRQIRAYSSALGRDQAETDVTFETDGIDAKADWLVHSAHLLSFGVNAWRMQASPERYLNTNAPLFDNRVRNDPFRDGRIDALGIYLQDDMRFGALGVLAGLRRDTVKGSAASLNNGAVTTGLDRSDSATSGSLGAIYEIAPLLRPYASVSRAFRAGDMRERFESSPRGDGFFYLGNPQIRPEVATQFEAGLKGATENLVFALAAYRNRITDYITGRVTGAFQSGLPVKQTENIGKVTLRGIEAEGRWQFLGGQWATLGYSRVRGTNEDLHEPLFQTPADELSLGWEGGVAQGWTADAAFRLVRRQDRVARVFSRDTENATPGFATADFGLTYRWQQQRVRLALRNAFDKAYHEHLSEGVSGQEIHAPGRSLLVAWQGRF